MSKSHSFDRFDFDVVWTAISRSKQMQSAIADTANNVKSECQKIARAVAYDEGDYKDAFDTAVVTGTRAREAFNTRARRRRGAKQGANRFIDKTGGDPDGSNYVGTLGTVFNTDFKARWVEFGSMAKGPRMVMATSAQNVVNRAPGASYEQLYDAAYQQNRAELARRISAAKKKQAGQS